MNSKHCCDLRMVFFAICILLNTIISYAQWVQQTSGVTAPLYNVQFVNLNTGWVTGSNSVILKTTNGGTTWVQQNANLSQPKTLYGLCMLNELTGYIAGNGETRLKTTNGGTNWIILRDGSFSQGNSLTGASFIDANTGWFCGFGGVVLHTSTGGAFWDSTTIGNTGTIRDIQFLNSLTGWVCGDVGNLRKSTDGGSTWTGTPLLTTANLDGLHFINLNTGWTVGEQDNMVFKTTNSGAKWDTVAVLPGGSLQYSYVVYFSSALTGWIGGTNSRVFKTTDGGNSWTRENAVFLAFFRNFSFYNDSIGWTVGGQGTIIKTTTSGEPLGITIIENSTPSGFSLYQNYPNPFNNSTSIEFEVPEKDMYKLEIYDVLGRNVDNLINKFLNRGKYRIIYNAYKLSTGTYFYRLSSTKFTQTRKLILTK